MQKKEKEFGIRSVEKAFALLDHILASPEGISLSTLASKTLLIPATARNLLRTMEKSSHVQRTPDHLYKPGNVFFSFCNKHIFSEEDKNLLHEYVKKLSRQCGETICLFCREKNMPPSAGEENVCCYIASHPGNRGVIAGEEAARESVFEQVDSPAKTLLSTLQKGEGNTGNTEICLEGKVCKNSLWSICVPLFGRTGTDAVLAVFLPVGRATKEKCNMLKEFLLSHKESSAFPRHFFK